jgi:hypothetical protein
VVVRKKKLRSLGDLAAADYNPRVITPEAAAGLRTSIQKFGDLAGITWNAHSGRLVTGHQRVSQLMAAGATLVGGALVLPSGERFPVRIVEWDARTEKAANVAANSTAIQGQWTDALEALLAEIHAETPDLYQDLLLTELSRPSVREVGKSATEPGRRSPALVPDAMDAPSSPSPARGSRSSRAIREFAVLVICDDEDHQRQALDRLSSEGYTVALL